jgi:uncharacterized protein (DUF58 family)
MSMIGFNKKIFPLTFIVLTTLALLVGGKYLYFIFYLFLLVVFIPWIWLKVSLNRLTGSIEPSAVYAEVGQYLPVKYILKNRSYGRFPYLELASNLDASLASGLKNRFFCLDAGEQATFAIDILCARRGIYALKSFQVRTGDPFGIFQLSKTLSAHKEIRVYPQVKPLPILFPQARRHFGSLKAAGSQLENYSQFSSLRQWQKGDSRKIIHWKQSARQDQLLVKNFEQQGDAKVNIFIDMAAESYDLGRRQLEDMAVETAAALTAQFLKFTIPVELYSQSLTGIRLTGHQLRDYWALMDQIIAITASAKTAFHQFVYNHSYHLRPGSTLYLVTPLISHPAAIDFLRLHYQGFKQILLYLTASEPAVDSHKLMEKLRGAGVKVYYSSLTRPGDHERKAL